MHVDLPVGARTQRNTVWAVGHRPDLRDDNPGARAPRVSEMDDEEPDHDHSGPSGGLVVFPVRLERGGDGGLECMSKGDFL